MIESGCKTYEDCKKFNTDKITYGYCCEKTVHKTVTKHHWFEENEGKDKSESTFDTHNICMENFFDCLGEE